MGIQCSGCGLTVPSGAQLPVHDCSVIARRGTGGREVFVQVSRELLAELSADWSRPVQVRIAARDGDVLELHFREVRAE